MREGGRKREKEEGSEGVRSGGNIYFVTKMRAQERKRDIHNISYLSVFLPLKGDLRSEKDIKIITSI